MDLPNNVDIVLSPAHNLQELFMLYERLVHLGETLGLTELEILGCELHQNAFSGRAPPDTMEELWR